MRAKKIVTLAVGLMSTALVLGVGSRANASTLQLNFTDILGGSQSGSGVTTATTLGATTLTQNTPFLFQGTFDTTTGNLDPSGDYLYPITSFTMSFDVNSGGSIYTSTGATTYTGGPASLNVLLADPAVTAGAGYGLGISDSNGSGGWWVADTHPNAIMFGYNTATPALNVSAPTPTVFTDPFFFCYSTVLNIPLVGVPGGLQLNDGPNGYAVVYPQYNPNVTASLAAPVVTTPEPATLSVLGLGGLLLLRRRNRS